MTLRILLILIAVAGYTIMNGCNQTHEADHNGESVEEHESHDHEQTGGAALEHAAENAHSEDEEAHEAHSDSDVANLIVFPRFTSEEFWSPYRASAIAGHASGNQGYGRDQAYSIAGSRRYRTIYGDSASGSGSWNRSTWPTGAKR